MKRAIVFYFLLLFIRAPLYPETFLISILNEHNLSALVISPERGKYRLLADGNEIHVSGENDLVYVSMMEEKLALRNHGGSLGIFSSVSFNAIEDDGEFSIRSVDPSMERGYYNGSLDLSVDFGRIKVLNAVCEEHYLAGVVEAEAGLGYHLSYYKAQAIISRTYLYGNLHRHADEGFHLCDEVHCQVYKGRLTGNKTVYEAVNVTPGKVLIYGDNNLITAAFHSNCGGQTVNSEEVWLVHRPYLRSVIDPYCRERRSAVWQRRIDAGEWGSYLANMGFERKSGQPDNYIFSFRQHRRFANYSVGGFNIPFSKIRSDWNFRSAFFDVEVLNPGNHILIRGRGHGHGAGLCQEGAMEMAARGYNFIDILQFYYTDVKIININDPF